MIRLALIAIAIGGLLVPLRVAYAQSVTVFGNSDAQQCYIQTRLFSGGSSALTICNKALKSADLSRKDRAATLVNRGINYTRSERHALALADFENALKISPTLAEAFINRGNTFIFTNQFDRALADYNRALELGAKEAHAAYYNRGLAYEALKDLEHAYLDFLQAQKLRPNWSLPAERIERYEAANFRNAK